MNIKIEDIVWCPHCRRGVMVEHDQPGIITGYVRGLDLIFPTTRRVDKEPVQADFDYERYDWVVDNMGDGEVRCATCGNDLGTVTDMTGRAVKAMITLFDQPAADAQHLDVQMHEVLREVKYGTPIKTFVISFKGTICAETYYEKDAKKIMNRLLHAAQYHTDMDAIRWLCNDVIRDKPQLPEGVAVCLACYKLFKTAHTPMLGYCCAAEYRPGGDMVD